MSITRAGSYTSNKMALARIVPSVPIMEIGLSHYLTVGAILFTLGVFGIFLNRKNVIVILMSIELILLAVNINFLAFSQANGDLMGQIFALLVLTVAAAEAAIGRFPAVDNNLMLKKIVNNLRR